MPAGACAGRGSTVAPAQAGELNTVARRNTPQHQKLKLNLVLPMEVEHWSLTTLQEELVKIDAKVVSHGRYVTFQLAEVTAERWCDFHEFGGYLGNVG